MPTLKAKRRSTIACLGGAAALTAAFLISASNGQQSGGLIAAARAAPSSNATGASSGAHLPGYNVDRNAYFGDLHVHTYLSFDAYIFNVRATPNDAYRFAKGEAIGHASGFDIRLQGGPLDFTAVTDHAEYLGAWKEGNDPNSPLSKLPMMQGMYSRDFGEIQKAYNRFIAARRSNTIPPELADPAITSRAWREVQDAAALHNNPGRFTTLLGYEYTGSGPAGQNLHRNVIFGGARVPALPFSTLQSGDPESLWHAMDEWRAKGMDALAIPHNSNGSDGLMFDSVRRNGAPIDRAYAELRARNEPLVEISQIKGTSETHPSLSPNDEWANFEIMERYIGTSVPITRFAGGYVRQALRDGIIYREKLGVNPFKLGFIGSSDTHNGAPGSVEEPNYFSKSGLPDGEPIRRGSVPPGGTKVWPADTPDNRNAERPYQAWGASGLAGVWAEENSRESIFAALRRKETFATSGPRIKVRFFAGYTFPQDLLNRPDTVRQAYAHGIPMGGDLLASKGRAPQFLVWAQRDPRAGYLQRAQIVKGWIEDGQAKEKVFDVSCSDGLKVGANGRCPDNGATVDLKTCEPDRTKGDVELRTLWRDPEFNPRQLAFYYVRILENPSCRWSTWDAIRNGTPPNPKLLPTVMERAWSSPIWYEPNR